MSDSASLTRSHRHGQGFLERNIGHLLQALERANHAESLGEASGVLTRLDPRFKLISAGALLIAAIASRSLLAIGLLLLACVALAWWSSLPLLDMGRFLWASVLAFTGLLALPALFLTPGDVLWYLPLLHWPVTSQGVRTASFLILRGEATATIMGTLVLSTPWTTLLRSLRSLGVPTAVVTVVAMTYRYVFLLLELSIEMFQSRRSRIVARLRPQERRRLLSATAGVLLTRSEQLSNGVYQAMLARGFRGEFRQLSEMQSNGRDWCALAISLLYSVLLIGRW